MLLDNTDIEGLARSVNAVMTAMTATGDRQRAQMALLACVMSLTADTEQDRMIVADALLQSAAELCPHIKLRLAN